MGLSSDLISQFAKITKDEKKTKNESTVFGTVKGYNDKLYVQIDGSDLLTPTSTTADMKIGERVMIQLKDHSATIVGNISSPAARTEDVRNLEETLDNLTLDYLTVEEADIKYATIDSLNTVKADIKELQTNKLDAETADIRYATIENLDSANAEINDLKTNKLDTKTATMTYATIESLNSANAEILYLKTNKLDAESANLKYANIDFSNINMASVETLFTKSGIIDNLVVDDTRITGELVGVTIKGDLIEGNTIVAEKLVVKGEDGLYYKLNTDGIKVEAEQTNYNSLNGSIITSKSITATKIAVSDLVAFDATIGGFKISDNSIYSGAKESATNTTRGIYFDNDGQVAFGDSNNFLKYYKDQNGNYKLEISAESVSFSTNNKNLAVTLTDLQEQIDRINSCLQLS